MTMHSVGRHSVTKLCIRNQIRFMIVLIVCYINGCNSNSLLNLLGGGLVNGLRNVYTNGNTFTSGGTFPATNNGYSISYPINGNGFNTINGGSNMYIATVSPPGIVYNNNQPSNFNRRPTNNRDGNNFEYEYFWEYGPDGKKRERFNIRRPNGNTFVNGQPVNVNQGPGRRFGRPWENHHRPGGTTWTESGTNINGNQPIVINNGGQPLQPQPIQPLQPQPIQPQPIQPQPVRPQPVFVSTAAPVYETSENTRKPPRGNRVVAGTPAPSANGDDDYVDSEEPELVITPSSESANQSPLEKAAKVCGLTYNTRIVGGKEADPNAWTWMAALIRKNGSNYCGGALITDQHVLTAAHCLKGITPREMFVRLGAYDFTDDASATSVDHDIENFRIHPQYDRYTHRHDIAILKMKKKAEFTHFIRPVCMPPKRRSFVNELATVVGWGATDFGAPSSNKLREVTIPIWDNKDCTESYKQNITTYNLCAGFKEGGKDSCQGDSGGPLMLPGAKNKWTIVGIVSWGIRCGEPGYPGVYTRVNRYLDWLNSNVKVTN